MNATANLLDANVWLGMAADFHPHHAAAKRRWAEFHAGGIVFNRIIQMGFLRLLTNPTVMGPQVRTNRQAWTDATNAFRLADAREVEEPAHLADHWEQWAAAQPAARDLWTDSYLAAFAACARLRLVTFDAGFKRFKGLDCLILETTK